MLSQPIIKAHPNVVVSIATAFIRGGYSVEELVDDFVDNAFGEEKEPMRAFYELINQDHASVRSHEDVVARMYRWLAEARELTGDARVLARLDDLILYTRYLELYTETPMGTHGSEDLRMCVGTRTECVIA
jgi:hypothetical protein